MEHKNIIIILIAVIIVLAAMLGVMILHPFDKQEPTKLKITSEKTLYEGDSIKVKLMDFNGTGIAKQKVNITITDKDNTTTYYSVVTNGKGVGKLELDKPAGKYKINCIYGGNENYTGNNTTQKLTIKEEVVETQTTSDSSSEVFNDTYVESSDGTLTYGYKEGRYGFWTPSGNFIEDKSRALSGEDPVEPFTRDGDFYS